MQQTLPSPPTSPAETTNAMPRLKRKLSNHDEYNARKQLRTFDMHLLEQFLSHGGSPNVRDKQDLSLLFRACQLRSLPAVKRLLLHPDLDINTVHGPNRLTALHIATLTGFDSAISLLLRHGARVEAIDALGRTALDLAVMHRQEDCVDHIIQHKPPQISTLTSTNAEGRNLLEEAIFSGSAPILRRLLTLTQDAGDDNISTYLIERAVFWNRIECLDVLLSFETKLLHNLHKVLYLTVQQRKLDMVRRLRAHGVNPCSEDGRNPCLVYATNHGFLDMIPLLLTETTRPACIQQALLVAGSTGHYSQVFSVVNSLVSRRTSKFNRK